CALSRSCAPAPSPAPSPARSDMSWFIANGYVGALLAGNAVAVHDIEASIYGTTLGMSNTGEITQGDHGLHMRAINRVRAAGSIANAVSQGIITDGIMYSCVKHNVPFVLTGSITYDGPLPGVITDMLVAQDAMRQHTMKATMAILVATALHAIATGNMLPAFVQNADGTMRELPTICVDSSEFVVSKLKDRGTHQAFGVVTNAQDFMTILRLYVERELESRAATARAKTEPAAARGTLCYQRHENDFSSPSRNRSRPNASRRFTSSRRSSTAASRAASPCVACGRR